MSRTTSFVGGEPLGFGIVGLLFVSLRFDEACGGAGAGAGVLGAGPAGVWAVLVWSPPPQPATATAAAARRAGSWMRLFTDGQASEPRAPARQAAAAGAS